MIENIKKIANHYDFDKVSRQLSQECAALIQYVNKYQLYNESLASMDEILTSNFSVTLLIQDVVGEIANVEIKLEQMKHLLHINPEAIEEIKLNKINEQLEIIEKEK